ncbi:MAG: hypothetical protein WCG32_01305 [Actinomycetes bacterium]
MKNIALDVKAETALGDLAGELKGLPKRKNGKLIRVPDAIQDRVVKLLNSGLSAGVVSDRLGVSENSLRVWQRARKSKSAHSSGGRWKRTAKGKTGFTQVRVREEETKPLPIPGALVLELAGGARVHGLSLEQLRALVSGGGLIT